MLVITTPAVDPNLLTAAEMRVAVGLAADDTSADTALATLNARVSRFIASYCKVRRGGATALTMRQETVTETILSQRTSGDLVLSRRPVVSVTSVTENGVLVSADSYELDASAGILMRFGYSPLTPWGGINGRVVVVYVAGWNTVPDDLKYAAESLAASIYDNGDVESNLKRIRVDGVSEREYFYGQQSESAMPKEVTDVLAAYVNLWMG